VLFSIFDNSENYLRLTFSSSLKNSNSNLNFGHDNPSSLTSLFFKQTDQGRISALPLPL
jgi:hypothetical protein